MLTIGNFTLHAVCIDEQSGREQAVQEKLSPAAKHRPGHRRNVSDTSANAISLPGHQSAFQLVHTIVCFSILLDYG